MEGHTHIEDNMTTQRLYWYRKQRLTHNGPSSRSYMPHQTSNIQESYKQDATTFNTTIEYTKAVCPNTATTNINESEDVRLRSCRFDRNERYSSNTTIESKDGKSNQTRKDLSNLPPLDISEVIETLTTLSSEGKLGKGNASPKEGSEDETVKVKGMIFFQILTFP